MKDERCEFCENYTFKKLHYKVFRKMCLKENVEPTKKEFSVAIVEIQWRNSKKNATRTTDYRHLGLGYELNFCPECGKQLRRRKNNEH